MRDFTNAFKLYFTLRMSNNIDRRVNAILIFSLCLYAAVLITGLVMHQLYLYIFITNAVAGLLLMGYWIWNKLRPPKRSKTERREIIIFSAEGLFVAIALYALFSGSLNDWLIITQYIIFALHAVVLILFLIFMLTFKIKKLF